MTPQQANLAPCPFCGSQAEQFTDEYGEGIECKTCEFQFGPYTKLEHAIAAWNLRAPAPTEPAVDRDAVAALKANYDGDPNSRSAYLLGFYAAKDAVLKLFATPASPAVPEQPVAWFEADPSAKGLPLREVIGGMVHSTRFHSTKPEVLNNALWPLYENPAPQVAQASQPTSAEGKDSERLDETNVALPTLKPGQSWCCGGCGSGVVKNPKRIDFKYSREEMPDGRVISKTTPQYVAPCCGGELILWNDEIDDSEAWQYVAIAERASTGKDTDKEATK